MSWAYVAVAAATVVGGALSADAAGDAADAQAAGVDAATAEQRRQFNQTRQDLMPWLDFGRDALGLQQRFINGDQTAYTESPDYRFRFDQGSQALQNSASARGNLFGGGAQADLIGFGQGMAAQGINDWWNRLSSVSQTGQTTAQSLGGFGQAYGQAFGQNQMNAANARASSYAGQANAWGNTAGQLGQLGGQYMANRNQPASIGPVVKQPVYY